MDIKEVVEAWDREELSGNAAMFVIRFILYPREIEIDEEDIEWAKQSRKKEVEEALDP